MNLKVLGLITTVIGAGVSIASGIISEKQQDEKIQEAVKEAIEKLPK